ncbi:SIS domain-containing protein [Anoxybacterium hadale]|uniref:SIS domain-containing protein n=1 Tax=Anoxybacterium hadale TaxID=3408580 RepID=A0ACD1AAP3_9FIRM|nr:SIS domain-containing protein [Clostridiales bacterium]
MMEQENKSKCFDYAAHLLNILNRALETQWESIDQSGFSMATAIKNGCSIFVFGASHAGIIAQEMFYRTGGLAVMNAILPAEFMLNTRPVTQSSDMEQLEGYPSIILSNTPIQAGDVLILHSVSGRNTAAIEMADAARKRGIFTIGITNMTYTKGVTSRHKSGKKLCDLCDIVIDNCGDFEDSSMLLEGMNQKIAPTSSVIGCAIVNMLLIRTVEYLLEFGVEPPIFRSANVDGGSEFNKLLFEKYKDRIHYM